MVFSDFMMPRLSGMVVFRRVRLVNPQLAGRFVFVTGGGIDGEVRAFLADVPKRLLEKPCKNEELLPLAFSRIVRLWN